MSKHTLGPWVSHKYPSTGGGNAFVIQAGALRGITVASLSPGHTTDRVEETAEANARLIAAAPELLEALKGVLTQHHSPDSTEPEIVRAFAAIAKAVQP